MYEIDSHMDPHLLGVAWMIGHWEGTGNGRLKGEEDHGFSLTIDFTENGGNYLHYIMQFFDVDDQGNPSESLGVETGFWRPGPTGDIEVVIAHPEGVAEIYYGKIDGAKIELTTDAVVRTTTAQVEVTGGHRLYGNVESDLMFTYDRGTTTTDVEPHLWARLIRTS
ncbi:MAG: FABP family protein [Propionibacteriaceae bacterium]|jgi:hypothetical protein|nr:FABP family protein [Propionibacteriaceae bacterium]